MTITDIARVVHAAIETLNYVHGHTNYPQWQFMTEQDRKMFITGVETVLRNPFLTNEQIHDYWWQDRQANGWTYGPVRDYDKKTHPSMVPYAALSDLEKAKDELFRSMVESLSLLLDLPPK